MADITVVSRTQKLIVDMAAASVSVSNAGPPGPPGSGGAYLDVTPWTTIPVNPTDWEEVTPTWPVFAYRKFGDQLQFRGAMKNLVGLVSTGSNQSLVIGTAVIPEELRPPEVENYSGMRSGSSTGSQAANIRVATNGDVIFTLDAASTAQPANGWVSITGEISITADNAIPDFSHVPSNSADGITIADAGDILVAENVEDALQETKSLADTLKIEAATKVYAEQPGDIYTDPFTDTPLLLLTAPPITVPTGKLVRIIASYTFLADAVPTRVTLRITEGANVIGGARLILTTQAYMEGLFAQTIVAPSAGEHTYSIDAVRSYGTGTIEGRIVNNEPGFIAVELFGDA